MDDWGDGVDADEACDVGSRIHNCTRVTFRDLIFLNSCFSCEDYFMTDWPGCGLRSLSEG